MKAKIELEHRELITLEIVLYREIKKAEDDIERYKKEIEKEKKEFIKRRYEELIKSSEADKKEYQNILEKIRKADIIHE